MSDVQSEELPNTLSTKSSVQWLYSVAVKLKDDLHQSLHLGNIQSLSVGSMFSSIEKEKNKNKKVSYGYVDAQHRALNVMNLSCPVHTCCERSPVLQAAPIAHFKSLQTPDSNKKGSDGPGQRLRQKVQWLQS